MDRRLKNYTLRFTLIGIAIGFLISFLIIIIIIRIGNYDFSFETIYLLSAANPLNFFLLLTPVILTSVISYFAGIFVDRVYLLRKSDIEIYENRLDRVNELIEKIRKGEQKIEDDIISESDRISKSLINLSNELEISKTEEQERQKEEFQRSWTSEGLALFGAVLREHNASISILSEQVLKELVKYIDAQQAGFYIIDRSDQDNHLIKEIANFAFGRNRFPANEFQWGEGLIGACIIERKSTFVKKVDDSYFEIESGLGHAKPRSLLVVPIMTEEGFVHGALEIASFKEYEDFEVRFVEQIAESIATTISTLKINEETARLLQDSRQQALALTRQEDELRKTISDMRRLQENADIQSVAFRAYQDSTNKALIRAEFSNSGKIQFANKRFLNIFEYRSNKEVEEKDINNFALTDDDTWFAGISQDIINNDKHFEGLLNYYSKNGKSLWIESSYIGLRNDKGKVEKILFLGIDATELKENTDLLEQRLESINNSLLKLNLSQNGSISNTGDRIAEWLEYEASELDNMTIYDIIPDKEKQGFRQVFNNVIEKGNIYEGPLNLISKTEETLNFYCHIFPEKDFDGNIHSISTVLFDYTEESKTRERIIDLEQTITELRNEIDSARDRFNKRIETTRDDMRDLYSDIETSNIFYETTLRLHPDAVITIDADNQILSINQSVLEVWDVDEDNYTENPISSLLPELEKKQKGNYLGDLFNMDVEEKILGDREQVYIIDSKGKRKNLIMLMIEASLGLRKHLTVYLQRVEE